MRCEIIIDKAMAPRGRRMLDSMIEAAPIPVEVRYESKYDCDLLMVYGAGHEGRRVYWNKYLKAGKHVIGWDLGYWKHKDDNTNRMRVTIDADHPNKWLRAEAPERWAAENIKLRNDYNAHGPIVIVGMGQKSQHLYNGNRLEWERAAYARLKKEFPARRLLYRPKRPHDARLPHLMVAGGAIEQAIKGASLVVCRHSNVAVDACIAGVPVQCEDGAAYNLYQFGAEPNAAARLSFLQGLAWWNYKIEEAPIAWNYLLMRLSELTLAPAIK